MEALRKLAADGRLAYSPTTDELIMPDGRRFRRPPDISAEQLRSITYNGHPSTVPGRASQQRPAPRRPDGRAVLPATPVSPSQAALAQSVANMSIAGSDSNRRPGTNTAKDMQAKINALTGSADPLSSSQLSGYPIERLHPKYKTRPASFYTVGRVFSMLWSEPLGDVATSRIDPTIITSNSIAVTPFGDAVYFKVRRFVCIRSNSGYSNALPIHTYEGRGVSKPGVNKAEHCVIYCGRRPEILESEKPSRGENGMLPIAIKINIDSVENKIDERSRLNLGHPMTIQHNVKAKSCGHVAKESMRDLMMQFESVFSPSRGLPAQSVVSFAPVQRPNLSSRSSTRNSVGSLISSSSKRSGGSRSATSPSEATSGLPKAIRDRIGQGMSPQEAVRSLAKDISRSGALSEREAQELLVKALQSERSR